MERSARPVLFPIDWPGVSAHAAGDFDRDGKMDLAYISDGIMRILPGNGDGTFGSASAVFEGGSPRRSWQRM
jgi:hypothetical protein